MNELQHKLKITENECLNIYEGESNAVVAAIMSELFYLYPTKTEIFITISMPILYMIFFLIWVHIYVN